MEIRKINFKGTRSGKFDFSKGKKGKDEKKLIKESMDILVDKHTNRDLKLSPTDKNVQRQSARYKKTRNNLEKIRTVEDNQDLKLDSRADEDDDERERRIGGKSEGINNDEVTYNDVCDMVTAIHEHIGILEEQGINFNSGTDKEREKYSDLSKMLDSLNEMRGRLTRSIRHPQGYFRSKIKSI